jgi:cyclopropane-fatty-acyl-phospholipid synthase
LEDAEIAMLELTCERAQLEDGQRILELGCGWGSLTLWMAARYPHAHITAVSNSRAQRRFIEARCTAADLVNVSVVTADMNDYEPEGTFERIVSIEMFEHMRNYRELMRRIASWLDTDGSLFVHLFCHNRFAYLYEPTSPNDWMAREFFTGGTMPSDDLLLHFQEHLSIDERWCTSGSHYTRTLESWLDRLDLRREQALAVFMQDLSPREASIQLQRWRIFLMACSELFGYRGGSEWWVSHYRFVKRAAAPNGGGARNTKIGVHG